MKPFKFSKKNREYTKWGKNIKEVRVIPKAGKEAAPPGPALQADMDEGAAQGAYANLAVITHNDAEFVADFIFAPPGQPARVLSRVILTPVMAKTLAAALKDNLRRYELRFGGIRA